LIVTGDVTDADLLPENESDRLAALYRYEILDTPPEPSFDRIARQAAVLFNAPISLISFVDPQRQFFKSHYGIAERETPREHAFCAHAIQSSEVMVVCDATQDARFCGNPLVLQHPNVRFYAGAPLNTPDGFRLGTLCVIDNQPRVFPDSHQLAALTDLADHVVELLELHRAKRDLVIRSRELAESRKESHATEQRAAIALEGGRMGYWEWDAATGLIRFSPLLEKLLGLNHDEFDGSLESWLKHVYPDDHSIILGGIEAATRIQKMSPVKYRVPTASGALRWITTTGAYQKDETGRITGAHGVSWDSTDAENAAQELKLREALFRGVSECAPVGVFRSDANEDLIYANAKAAEIFGMSEQEMAGKGWGQRIHPEDRAALWAFLNSDKGREKSFEYEVRLLLPGGAVRWVLVRATVLYEETGRFAGKTGTVVDVTEQRQAIHYLREAKEAAELANRAKDFFLANVSHELRTPLNGVLGMSDQLIETGLNPEQLEMAQLIRESGRALLAVVDDMLDLGQMEAGMVSIERVPFELRKSIEQTVALFETDARREGPGIVVHCPAGLPDSYFGDASRIKQILANYLSNAVKFGEGEIAVTVRGEMAGGLMELLLAVSDSGPGIALDVQSQLFRPFSQIDDSSSRRSGGLGLGLAICRRLAELMGGTVGVFSAPGKGSTFWVRLQLECHVQQPAATAPLPAKSNEDVGTGRVLLVEDNLINQRVALGVLRRLGWQADVATNGVAAVELFQKSSYAVIFMDCQMPEMDGYLATGQIRHWEALHNQAPVPIIALTAHAMAGDRERCLAAGMNDYLSKPFGLEELRAALNRWTVAPTTVP
jgi:PAS domain S-box-containing protein